MRETKEQKMARLERQKAEKEEENKQLRKENRSLKSTIQRMEKEKNVSEKEDVGDENECEHYLSHLFKNRMNFGQYRLCLWYKVENDVKHSLSQIYNAINSIGLCRAEEPKLKADENGDIFCTEIFGFDGCELQMAFFGYTLRYINMRAEEENYAPTILVYWYDVNAPEDTHYVSDLWYKQWATT